MAGCFVRTFAVAFALVAREITSALVLVLAGLLYSPRGTAEVVLGGCLGRLSWEIVLGGFCGNEDLVGW